MAETNRKNTKIKNGMMRWRKKEKGKKNKTSIEFSLSSNPRWWWCDAINAIVQYIEYKEIGNFCGQKMIVANVHTTDYTYIGISVVEKLDKWFLYSINIFWLYFDQI